MVAYTLIQPIKDLKVQWRTLFSQGAYLGDIGDARHLRGSGDHTPWASDVIFGRRHKRGYVYAVDLGHDRVGPVLFNPWKYFLWLEQQLKKGSYPEIKYLITNYVLIDRRYGWRRQRGGDGPDHIHISFMPGSESAHSTIIRDYHRFLTGGGDVDERMGGEVAVAIAPLRDDWAVLAVRGTDGYLYFRWINDDGSLRTDATTGKPYGWRKVNVKIASPPQAVSRSGSDLWITALDSDRHVLLISTPNVFPGSATWTLQNVGGVGTSAPDILARPDRVTLTVRGVNGQPYTRGYVSDRGWGDWRAMGGQAA